MISLLYTGISALIIYISNIQRTEKYGAVMYQKKGEGRGDISSTYKVISKAASTWATQQLGL